MLLLAKIFWRRIRQPLPSEAIFWQSKNDFDQALTAIYTGIRGGISYNQALTTGYISSYLSFLGQYVGQLFGGEYQRIRRQRCVARPHNPVQLPSFGDIYGHCYSNIARINIYLDRLDQFIEDKTNADYKQLRGEAVGLRGLLYYYLYVCFGEVPVTKEATTVETMCKDKSDREAVYKAVIDDFNEAAALFWV